MLREQVDWPTELARERPNRWHTVKTYRDQRSASAMVDYLKRRYDTSQVRLRAINGAVMIRPGPERKPQPPASAPEPGSLSERVSRVIEEMED